ncbi:MAG: dihydrolipoyl dehydrogenase [Chloroflexi bacterium]|uniref:Dihydrolipoyl dehydrogenase n=1 Tax=Candidatus Chlorohelix allophototropha TaxID=3003348 RepID=A0A8T7LUS1_9CHLR|nr:dihydrolipoyl dehydrogenase [Chloroflexota bacterium]WJW67654.1 dihydrolipoyl dehydrogenase [Chloroflexota bacterium L227-S17]
MAEQNTDYDVVLIGSGPGGYIAAIRASQLGLKAAVVEREEGLGGICLNWGCIPSKTILRNAEVLNTINHAKDYGIKINGTVEADFTAGLERARGIIERQVKGVAFLMRKNKVEVVRGTGRLIDKNTVGVIAPDGSEQQLKAKHIIIATGSRVKLLPGMNPSLIDGESIITSKELWNIKKQPKSVIILGAGPIGVEFATVFNAYGTDVTVVEMLSRVVPLEDEEISSTLAREFKKKGIKVMTGQKVASVVKENGLVKVTAEAVEGGKQQVLEAELVVIGLGFSPSSDGLGLEELGVKVERGFIQVDEKMQTNVPGIYAIGDVTGKLALAHVASAMGVVAAENIAGHETVELDYLSMPRCTYTSPQIASIGLNEAQAKERGYEVKSGKFGFQPNGKAQALGEAVGFAKIITDAKTGEILGAHLIGPEVTELIAEFSLLRLLEGTVEELHRAVHPHPTLSEVLAEAGLAVEGLPLNA